MNDYDWNEMARRVRNNEIPNGDLPSFLRALYQLGVTQGSGHGPDDIDAAAAWFRKQIQQSGRT